MNKKVNRIINKCMNILYLNNVLKSSTLYLYLDKLSIK